MDFKPKGSTRYNLEFNKKHNGKVSVNEKNFETFESLNGGLAKALCTCPITFKPNQEIYFQIRIENSQKS